MATSVQEVQSILSSCLANKNLALQVNQTGNQLSVMINRSVNQSAIDYESVAETLMAKLRSLNLPNVNTVKLYGRAANTKQVEWQTSHPLITETAKPSVSSFSNGNASIAISQKPKSKFQGYLEQFSQYANVISAASLLGLLVLLGFNTFAGQKTQAVVHEYKIASVPDLTFTETMNVQGSEGWELVFARRAKESSSDDFTYECIFKRVKK